MESWTTETFSFPFLACLGLSLLDDKTHIQVGESFLLVDYLVGTFTDVSRPLY